MSKEYVKLQLAFGEIAEPIESDDLIYHYCSMDTLNAILKSKKVRLYDLLSMNDISELQIRRINFAQKLFNYYQKNPFDFNYKANGVEGDFESYLFPSGFNYNLTHGGLYTTLSFALCMSSKCNSLSQWRMYGNNGKGVCLGFSKEKIKKLIENNNDYLMQEVNYIDDFNKLVDDMIVVKYNQLKELSEKSDNDGLLEIQFTLFNDIYWEASKFKINDYSNEDEIRLVYQQKSENILPNANSKMLKSIIENDDIDLDLVKDELRIFKTIDIEKLGLKSIILGPCNDTSKQMMNLLLSKRNFLDDIDIYKSNIPFRG